MSSLIGIIPQDSFVLLNTLDPYQFVEYLLKLNDINNGLHTGCEYEITGNNIGNYIETDRPLTGLGCHTNNSLDPNDFEENRICYGDNKINICQEERSKKIFKYNSGLPY